MADSWQACLVRLAIFVCSPLSLKLDAVAESVEHRPRVREIGNSVPSRVKAMTCEVDTCRFLAWRSALIGYGKNSLAQCQDNVTESGIGTWCSQPDFLFSSGAALRSLWVCTVTRQYLSWYDIKCRKDIKCQPANQPTSQPANRL